MKTKIFNILGVIFFIILICFIHIGTLLVAMNITKTLLISQILHKFGIVSIIIYIFYKIINRKKINIYDIIIILLTIFAIISTIFAYNQKVALIGNGARYEGLYSILSYYSFFLLATTISKKQHKKIMTILVFFGILQIAIGTIQVLKINNILGYDRTWNWSNHFQYASGTLANPNFYSTYILMCLLWLFSTLFQIKGIIKKIFLSILVSIYIYGLVIGNTTSSILIFLFLAFIIIIFNFKPNKIKKNIFPMLMCLILAFSVLFIINKYNYNNLYNTMKKNMYYINHIFKYGLKDYTGSYRIYVWKETLKEVPNYLYTGIGIDNFKYIRKGTPIVVSDKHNTLYFDKAHNDYLQILITEGIFALISYLLLIILVFYAAFSSNVKKENPGLIYTFIGYLLQMIIVFSVITVAPIFYMIMGFIVSNKLLKE